MYTYVHGLHCLHLYALHVLYFVYYVFAEMCTICTVWEHGQCVFLPILHVLYMCMPPFVVLYMKKKLGENVSR